MTRTSSTSWHHDGIDRRPAFIGVYFRSLQTTSLPMDAHKRTGRLLWWFFLGLEQTAFVQHFYQLALDGI